MQINHKYSTFHSSDFILIDIHYFFNLEYLASYLSINPAEYIVLYVSSLHYFSFRVPRLLHNDEIMSFILGPVKAISAKVT